MAGYLNFDPSEFVVLEDAIEFDEDVQRSEAVRFYTLQEQEVDAFEKMVPKGRIPKFQRDQIQYDIERMHALYEEYILPTADDYLLREPVVGTSYSWVVPVYATPEFKSYNFSSSWLPVVTNQEAPNFYPRMVSALPHPFAETQEGVQYSLERPTEFLNADGQKPRRALPDFSATKGVIHEDKTMTIRPYPIAGTSDSVSFVGYALRKRPLPIPNPLPEHPFLAENKETFVPTTAPLRDVVPSMDAILTHAVPTTNDPYLVAEPYLKLYDVRLSDIPWSSWKSRFPPVEVVSILPDRVPIAFPESDSPAPSQKIVDGYKTTYAPGVFAREWLMRQDDGGDFVVRALQSAVIDNGSVESIPGIDLPIPGYPATTREECSLLGLTFPDFTTKGLLRRSWTIEKGKDIIKLECVPLEFIRQEQSRVGYVGRKPWKETTGTELLESHLKLLRRYKGRAPEITAEPPAKRTPARPDSQARLNVVAILQDPRRHVQDKLHDVQAILQDNVLSNNLYTDPNGEFVVCSHTLAILSGDYERDRKAFTDTWTALSDGFRTCKFCGEQIDVAELVDQDEYNEDGFRIKRAGLPEEAPTVVSESMEVFQTGLQALFTLFDMTNPVDAICFTLLSLLQVLPSGEFVQTILKIGREFAQKLGKDSDQILRVKGIVGLVMATLILQTHIPALVPRRSFGSKPLKLDGYPRDLPEPESFSILDTLIMVIANTFRAYPTSLSNVFKFFVRGALSNPKDIRKQAVLLLNQRFLTNPIVRKLLADAKAYQSTLPPVVPAPALLPVTLVPDSKAFGTIRQYAECPSLRPVLEGKNPPRIRQPEVPLRDGLQAARSRVEVVRPVSVRVQVAPVPKPIIQQRIALAKAVGNTDLVVQDPYRTNLAIASRLSDLAKKQLPLRTVDPSQNPAELRDLARGLVYESVDSLRKADPSRPINALLKTDAAIFCLTSDYSKRKAEAQSIRATERLKYVTLMGLKTDREREVSMELAKRGMAPILITREQRLEFAREVEDAEVGVGLPQDVGDQGESNAAGYDNGNYGDYTAVPINDGRDAADQWLLDDENRGI